MPDKNSNPASTNVPKFSLGLLVATSNAANCIPNNEIVIALRRHVIGDWGNLDKHDLDENERALKQGGRLFSSYQSSGGTKFWIITEYDRSVTTVLLPEDY